MNDYVTGLWRFTTAHRLHNSHEKQKYGSCDVENTPYAWLTKPQKRLHIIV